MAQNNYISRLSNEELTSLLLDLFYMSNSMMLRRDLSEIYKNVSERSICSNLKEMMAANLNSPYFEGYYADVEYNRGPGNLLKAIEIENEGMAVQCDLIVHSRGQQSIIDNLICIEMKKLGVPGVNEDRSRIIEMTKTDLHCYRRNRMYIVRGYKLGILYVYDYKNSKLHLEFYQNGQLIEEVENDFSYFISYPISGYSRWRSFYTLSCPSSITEYNMGFGDSFLIQNSFSQLLVDCGSNNPIKIKWNHFTKPHLLADLDTPFCSFLLTHYHWDHYNKINDLLSYGIKFDKVYIRNLGLHSYIFDSASYVFRLAYYFFETRDINTVYFWFKNNIFKELLKSSFKIIGINNTVNNHFYIGSLKADVLWPSPDCSDEILDFLEKNEFESFLSNYPTIKKYIDKYADFLKRILSEEDFSFERFSDYFDIFDEEDFLLIEKEIKAMVDTDKFFYLHTKMQSLENHLSIVFAISTDLLMCGDADNDALKNALCSYANQTFKIVKVPHHGTKKYYFDQCWSYNSTLLIPNSFSSINGEKIDSRYVTYALKCWNLNSTTNSSCPLASIGGCKKNPPIVLPFKKVLF